MVRLPDRKWIVGLMLFGVFGFVYAGTVFKIPLNYADSDDLTMAAYFGGLAHPPGYPLLIILMHFWLKTVPPASVAKAANSFNAIISALVVTLIFFICDALLNKYRQNFRLNRRQRWLIAGLSAVTFGTWQTSWFNARVLEVFPLAQALIGATMLLAIKINNADKRLKFKIALWGLIGITAVGFHPLAILVVLPTFVYGLTGIRPTKKDWLWLIGGGVGALILIGVSYNWGVNSKAIYSWPGATNLKGISQWLSRAAYNKNGSAVEADSGKFNLFQSFWSEWQLIWLWLKETYVLGTALFILGMVTTYRKSKKVFWWLGSCVLFSALGLTFYLKFPLWEQTNEMVYWGGMYLRWRMQFVAALPLAILAGIGWWQVFNWTEKAGLTVKKTIALAVILSLGLLVWAGRQQLVYYPQEIMNLIQEHSQEVLNRLPVGATLFVDNDQIFNFFYEQKILGIRNDIKLVPLRFDLNHDEIQTVALPFSAISDDNQAVEKILGGLEQNNEVFLYAPSVSLISFLGVEGDPFYAVPYGYTYKLSKKMPNINTEFNYRNTTNYLSQYNRIAPLYLKNFGAQLAYLHTQIMYQWERLGFEEAADKHKQLALSLTGWPLLKQAIQQSYDQAHWALVNHGSFAAYKEMQAKDYIARINKDTQITAEEIQYNVSRAILIDPQNQQYLQLLPR